MANGLNTAIDLVGRWTNQKGGSNLFYPLDIETAKNRPVIMFSCEKSQAGFQNIYLPMPMGVQASDSVTYNQADLNIMGVVGLNMLRAGKGQGDVSSALGAGSKEALSGIKQFMPKGVDEGILLAQMATTGNATAAAATALATQMTSAKNTITHPDGVPVRNHSFSFKLVARSQKEAQMIKNIQFVLRSGLYPQQVAGSELARLQFPPKWKIRYKSLPGLNDLEHLPQPYDTYLQSMTTNFNSGSTMWRNDGAPLEVDITLSFIETKSLTSADITEMQGGIGNVGGFNAGNVIMKGINQGLTSVIGKPAANIVTAILGGNSSGSSLNGKVGNSSPGSSGSSGLGGLGGIAGQIMSGIKKLF